MMTNMEVGKVDPLLELPEVCMRAGKSVSRTWRFTEADSNWAGRQVYLPESDISACKIVSVLTVVPAAMCSGGVVCSLAPL